MIRNTGCWPYALAGLFCLPLSVASQAASIDGAWANQASSCDKVFRKTRDKYFFRSNSDAFGNGFILEGNSIRGRLARCTIKLRKEDGPTVHLIGTCKTGIAIESVQFTLKLIGDDKLKQIFPGVPELEVDFERCSL